MKSERVRRGKGSTRRRGRAVLMAAGAAAVCGSIAILSLRAGAGAEPPRVEPEKLAAPESAGAVQGRSGHMHRRLRLQPEVRRMAGRLGERFVRSGREVAVLTGTLRIGNQQRAVQIIRRHGDEGEEVSIVLAGEGLLTWNGREGARAGGGAASASQRALVERVVLDSPDQFVLAQLRGAGYYVVARGAVPPEAAGDDRYDGPIWDVIRVGEPGAETGASASPWRIHHVNVFTGLIDRIISSDGGLIVEAELSEWGTRDNHRVPGRTIWRVDGEVVMELRVSNVTHGPRE